MSLTLLQCHPDPHRLAAWATRFGLTAGGDDLGYVLTAVDSRTNPASTAGTAQHDLDLVSG